MRPVASLAVALFLLLGLGACGPDATSSRPVHCEVVDDPPTRDNPQSPKRMVSTARFWCDDPGPDRLTLTVHLQKLDSRGHWSDATHKTFSLKGVATTRTRDTSYRTWSVSIPCANGDFRTVITGSSVSHKVTKTYDLQGPDAHNPCEPTLFS